MKFIQRVNLTHFRNSVHFEFMTEIGGVLSKINAEAFKLVVLLGRFFGLLADEDAALVQIRKYEATDEISRIDAERDNVFRGMNTLLKSALKHFDAEVSKAAERLAIVFNTYGDISRLSYDAETAAIHNLIQDLQQRVADTDKVGMTVWVNELLRLNNELRHYMDERYSEEAQRTHIRVRQVRKDIDNVYLEIADILEAGAAFNGVKDYEALFAEINARVSRYANILAQEKGRRAKSEKTGEIEK
jgi:hypothetical protein